MTPDPRIEVVAEAIYGVDDSGMSWADYISDGEPTIFRDYARAAVAALDTHDASRTAHATLVAELRAWVEFEEHHLAPCRTYRPYRTSEGPPSCDCDLSILRAVLDRHAPKGAT